MSILEQLNSGALHQQARAANPHCVDASGNVHRTPERADFIDWRAEMVREYGNNARQWPADLQVELVTRWAPA